MNNITQLIENFNSANKNCVISYGGDGTLLEVARMNNFRKAIFPIRNYGLCNQHENVLSELLGERDFYHSIKQTLHPLLRFNVDDTSDVAASEITIKNHDITSCMRIDIYVNDKIYMENVICDGIIFATSLGSHGYFKSVTRTIFSGNNVGIGFICPTYGINNLVLNISDKITLRFKRDSSIIITADKLVYNQINVSSECSVLTIFQEASNNLSLFGYDIFCCPHCRRNRNSTIINDQYLA